MTLLAFVTDVLPVLALAATACIIVRSSLSALQPKAQPVRIKRGCRRRSR